MSQCFTGCWPLWPMPYLCDMSAKRGILFVMVAVLLFGAGFAAHSLVGGSDKQDTSSSHSNYPLLAKRLFVTNPNDPIINFVSLREQYANYFKQNNLSGSLYFEYLPTGTSAQIEGDNQEIAASLMKLPAAMDAYKAVEEHKISLDKVITLQQSWLDNGYGNLYQQGAGYQLTLKDALRILLEQSDNTALKAVTITTFDMIKPVDSSLNAVDISLTQNPDLTVSIGARSYGSFLKCLYFSCYNSPQDSQAILNYLTQTPFKDRLVAGIADKSVKVAHKIGVGGTTVQSDCGIVYVPNRNYVLCVMLHGDDTKVTNQHIAAISKLTYEYIKQK